MSDETNNQDEEKPVNLTPSTRNGIVPPVEHRFKPGQSGHPAGRKSAGATVREQINRLAEQDLSEDELRQIARSKKLGWTLRFAAEHILRGLEHGDIADFAGLLRGENNIEDLRGMGINTEVVKKLKQKTRKVNVGDGKIEEVIEREIELHDRSGAGFDRIVNQTAGMPKQMVEADITSGGEKIKGYAIISPDDWDTSTAAPNSAESDRNVQASAMADPGMEG